MNDVLLIDKPKGITSYDVVRRLKQKYPRGAKIGHAGTLDPNASGLMVIGIGSGTKKLKSYLGLDKTYEAEILFGIQTDSGDITGKVIKERDITSIDTQTLEKILAEMTTTLRLPVSKFSAKKIGGKALYKRAHAEEYTPTILQDMTIHEARLTNIINNTADVTFVVDSGTYIRSIAEEIGRQLNIPATLKNLRRTKIGEYNIKNAEPC